MGRSGHLVKSIYNHTASPLGSSYELDTDSLSYRELRLEIFLSNAWFYLSSDDNGQSTVIPKIEIITE